MISIVSFSFSALCSLCATEFVAWRGVACRGAAFVFPVLVVLLDCHVITLVQYFLLDQYITLFA